MKIVYQSLDPSVNPGLFPSATVKELKTAGAVNVKGAFADFVLKK